MTQNPTSADLPETSDLSTTTKRDAAPVKRIRRSDIRRAERAMRGPQPKVRPLRAAGTMAAVIALLAGVAIPAYAATQVGTEQVTAHDIAEADAQTLTVDEAATASSLSAGDYSATTMAEIEEKKAAAEAAERAKKLAAMATTASVYTGAAVPDKPSAGVVFPLPGGSYSVGRGLGDSGYHQGRDLLARTGAPIFAVADGVVSSTACCGAYGNVVFVKHNVGGSAVETRSAHMSSIAVAPGQSVTAGQVIGYVGSTGRSTAPHLHIEVRVNGGLVEPLAWLP